MIHLLNQLFFSFWSLVVLFFVIFIFAGYYKEGINRELDKQTLLIRKNHYVIKIQKRHLSNMFNSSHNKKQLDSEYLKGLSELDSRFASIIHGEMILKAPVNRDNNSQLTKQEINIIFVTDNFFSMAQGMLFQGKYFSTPDEVLITPGIAKMLYGKVNEIPNFVFLNNQKFNVAGMWDFQNDSILENRSIIIPISAIDKFDLQMDPVSYIVMKGFVENYTQVIEQSIAQINIQKGDSNYIPNYSYTLQSHKFNSEEVNKFNFRFRVIDLILWLIAVLANVLLYLKWDKILSQNLNIFIVRKMIGWNNKNFQLDFLFFFLLYFLSSAIIGILVGNVICFIFKLSKLVPISIGTNFSFSIFLFILSLILFVHLASKRAFYLFNWKQWLRN